jgi:hypothetical protein
MGGLFRSGGYRWFLRLVAVQSELCPHLCHFQECLPVFFVVGLADAAYFVDW